MALQSPLKSSLSLHINHPFKGALPYLHCAGTEESQSVPEGSRGGCDCGAQKGFLFHSSGGAESSRARAVFGEGRPRSAARGLRALDVHNETYR